MANFKVKEKVKLKPEYRWDDLPLKSKKTKRRAWLNIQGRVLDVTYPRDANNWVREDTIHVNGYRLPSRMFKKVTLLKEIIKKVRHEKAQ